MRHQASRKPLTTEATTGLDHLTIALAVVTMWLKLSFAVSYMKPGPQFEPCVWARTRVIGSICIHTRLGLRARDSRFAVLALSMGSLYTPLTSQARLLYAL